MFRVGVGDLDPQDLLVVIAALDVARDNALGAKCLARLCVEKLESLIMQPAFAEVVELLSGLLGRHPVVIL